MSHQPLRKDFAFSNLMYNITTSFKLTMSVFFLDLNLFYFLRTETFDFVVAQKMAIFWPKFAIFFVFWSELRRVKEFWKMGGFPPRVYGGAESILCKILSVAHSYVAVGQNWQTDIEVQKRILNQKGTFRRLIFFISNRLFYLI